MPCARMRAQVGQLHTQNVVFLGLESQLAIQLSELLRRYIGGAKEVEKSGPTMCRV